MTAAVVERKRILFDLRNEWKKNEDVGKFYLHLHYMHCEVNESFFHLFSKKKKILYAFFPLRLLQFSRLRFHLLMGKITFVLRTELIFIFFSSFVILRMLKVIYSFLFPKQNFLLIQMSYVDRNKD